MTFYDIQVAEILEGNAGRVGLDWDAWKRSIGGQIGLRVSMQPVIATESAAAQIGIAMNTLTGFGKQDRPILTEQNLTNRFTL